MLIVVGSGLIGRFVYTKIHEGLYGRRLSLIKVQEELANQAGSMQLQLQEVPRVGRWVQQFEQEALRQECSTLGSVWRFLGLGIRRRLLTGRCRRALHGLARNQALPGKISNFRYVYVEDAVAAYLREIQRVAQFSAYERLFSLWHHLHVPLIYILAASTMFHVVAVYMY